MIKRFIGAGIIALAAVFAVVNATPEPAEAATTVTICHNTGSQSNPQVTITVSVASLFGHLIHGDSIGPCATPTPTPTVEPTQSPTPTETPAPEPTSTPAPTPQPPVVPEDPRDSCEQVNAFCGEPCNVAPSVGCPPVVPTSVPPMIVVIDEGAVVTGEAEPTPLHYSYVYDAFIATPTASEALVPPVFNSDGVQIPIAPHSGNGGFLSSDSVWVALGLGMLAIGVVVLGRFLAAKR